MIAQVECSCETSKPETLTRRTEVITYASARYPTEEKTKYYDELNTPIMLS